MTNFEWLVKNKKITKLFREIVEREDLSDVLEEWSIPSRSAWLSDSIVEWLQAVHKTKKYVALDDVIEILRMPRKLNLSKPNQKVGMTEIMAMEAHHNSEIQTALFSLEVKEIDE